MRPLVAELLEFSLRPSEAKKKRLWADHQALKPVESPPVCVYYDGIPDQQWNLMLDSFQCKTPAGRFMEFDLQKRIWMAKNVPDDNIVWPSIAVNAVAKKKADWGVKVKWHRTAEDDGLGARKAESPFKEGIEVGRLQFSDQEIDAEATALLAEEFRELCLDKLAVFVKYPTLGASPFDLAVELRGAEELLFDCVDAPEKVKELMEYLTSAFEAHHKAREQKGHLNFFSPDGKYGQFGWRVHSYYPGASYIPGKPRLRDEWFYVSAQTSSGLGPEMYAEFVHPYNCRLAKLMTNKTVYYHGCETLDQKLDILATLPNLRRQHVSPWSSVKTAVEKFKGSVVLEIHSHPGKVFFGFSKEDMKTEIKGLVEQAEGVPFDLNLSDIHTVNGNPKLLAIWTEAAKEVLSKSKNILLKRKV